MAAAENHGCDRDDGWMPRAFEYLQREGVTVCTDASYPHKANRGRCHADHCTKAVRISGFIRPSTQSDANLLSLAQAVAVSVGVAASNHAFWFHGGGILDSDVCNGELDRGVAVVGAGTDSDSKRHIDCYRVKNS